MKRILVAFDDSPGAGAAMQDMVRGGFPERCEATVLAIADVWLPPDSEKSEEELPPQVATSRRDARQHALDALSAAREISQRGVERLHRMFPAWTVHPEGHADSPAWGILNEAKKFHADLIVIGSHGRSPLQKFFLGSVSYKVAAEAQCPVRVFREHGRDSGSDGLRLLVGVDGSGDSDRAVEEVRVRRWPSNTKIELVTVAEPKVKTKAVMDAARASLKAETEKPEDSISSMLAERAKRLSQPHLEVSTKILEGDAKGALLRHAEHWKADCIFLGARGLHHGARLYLGTLASAIMTRAHCTVEIVRPMSV
jgi:nucleotide-binding universal stress UspA family protein